MLIAQGATLIALNRITPVIDFTTTYRAVRLLNSGMLQVPDFFGDLGGKYCFARPVPAHKPCLKDNTTIGEEREGSSIFLS